MVAPEEEGTGVRLAGRGSGYRPPRSLLHALASQTVSGVFTTEAAKQALETEARKVGLLFQQQIQSPETLLREQPPIRILCDTLPRRQRPRTSGRLRGPRAPTDSGPAGQPRARTGTGAGRGGRGGAKRERGRPGEGVTASR